MISNYTLELVPVEVQQILGALSHMPFRDVARLIGKIEIQIEKENLANQVAQKMAEEAPAGKEC